MSDIFAVGDNVVYLNEIVGRFMNCQVTRVMPGDRSGRNYHIRDIDEPFERSVSGDRLWRDVSKAALSVAAGQTLRS